MWGDTSGSSRASRASARAARARRARTTSSLTLSRRSACTRSLHSAFRSALLPIATCRRSARRSPATCCLTIDARGPPALRAEYADIRA